MSFPSRRIRGCRQASGFTLRALASRAGTSHSTLAAYEAGRKVPTAATFERIVHAANWDIEIQPLRGPSGVDEDLRGQELEDVLALAAQFPARHDPVLRAPVFGRR